jgi:hypothetical protein
MSRPIDALLGNIDPLTGLRRGMVGGNASYMQSPVKVSALPQIGNNPSYNTDVTMRSGNNIPIRPMTNAGVIAGSRLTMPTVNTLPVNQPEVRSGMSGLLGSNFTDPKTMGLLGASAELLKAGGYSVGKPAPTMGEALGKAMTTGMANYLAVQQAQNKANAPVSLPKGGMLVNPRTGQVVVDGRNKGGMFSGSGLKTDVYNTLIELNPRIQKDGFKSLNPNEQAKYRLAYGNASKKQIDNIEYSDGTKRQIERPAQDMTGFFNPFPNQQSGKNVVGEKPSPKMLKFIEQKPKLFTMLSNLNKYKISLKNSNPFTQISGAISFPTSEATKLRTEAEALRLNIKDLEELGALVGGDFQILANRLTSPTTGEGLRIGKDGLLVQLENLENQILDKLQEGGFTDATGAYSDPIPANDPKVWEQGRFGLYYKLPNNRVVLKQRKLK